MSRLLQSGRNASAADWAAELAEWEGKLADTTKRLAAAQAEVDDISRDQWFAEQAKPARDLLKNNHDRYARTVAALKVKLSEAEAARPAALKELASAYKERDALGDEIAERFPALIAELSDLMSRAAANERRLLKVAAAGEGEINSTSPWDRARGEKRRPLVVSGPAKAAPSVTLHDLAGKPLWPLPGPAVTAADLPSVMTAQNKGDRPVFGNKSTGQIVVIEPGCSVTAPGIGNLLAAPSVELTVN